MGKVKNTKGRIHQQLGSRILRMLDYSSRGAGRQRVTKFCFFPQSFLLFYKENSRHTHEHEAENEVGRAAGRRQEHQSPVLAARRRSRCPVRNAHLWPSAASSGRVQLRRRLRCARHSCAGTVENPLDSAVPVAALQIATFPKCGEGQSALNRCRNYGKSNRILLITRGR